MKRIPILLHTMLLVLLCGCGHSAPAARVAATTLPVYEFTARICEDTPITVTRLVTEKVSCLHDYSLNVQQVKAAEAAELIVISGADLEEFMEDILQDADVLDASQDIRLICPEDAHHDHGHGKLRRQQYDAGGHCGILLHQSVPPQPPL